MRLGLEVLAHLDAQDLVEQLLGEDLEALAVEEGPQIDLVTDLNSGMMAQR